MKVRFVYKNVSPSEAMEEYAKGCLSKASDYLGDNAECTVVFKVQKQYYTCEMTSKVNKYVVRAEVMKAYEKDAMYTAIHECADKLIRGIVKKKEKDVNRHKTVHLKPKNTEADYLTPLKVAKVKEVSLDILSEEEAIEALELVGHEFYMYIDKGTGNVAVIYKRDFNKYGKESYGVLLSK